MGLNVGSAVSVRVHDMPVASYLKARLELVESAVEWKLKEGEVQN